MSPSSGSDAADAAAWPSNDDVTDMVAGAVASSSSDQRLKVARLGARAVPRPLAQAPRPRPRPVVASFTATAFLPVRGEAKFQMPALRPQPLPRVHALLRPRVAVPPVSVQVSASSSVASPRPSLLPCRSRPSSEDPRGFSAWNGSGAWTQSGEGVESGGGDGWLDFLGDEVHDAQIMEEAVNSVDEADVEDPAANLAAGQETKTEHAGAKADAMELGLSLGGELPPLQCLADADEADRWPEIGTTVPAVGLSQLPFPMVPSEPAPTRAVVAALLLDLRKLGHCSPVLLLRRLYTWLWSCHARHVQVWLSDSCGDGSGSPSAYSVLVALLSATEPDGRATAYWACHVMGRAAAGHVGNAARFVKEGVIDAICTMIDHHPLDAEVHLAGIFTLSHIAQNHSLQDSVVGSQAVARLLRAVESYEAHLA